MCHIHDNTRLVNYARRHHKRLPVSSSIAESAVNRVVSLRVAKKRQNARVEAGCSLSRAGSSRRPQRAGGLPPSNAPVTSAYIAWAYIAAVQILPVLAAVFIEA
jgi:hypothetical protein